MENLDENSKKCLKNLQEVLSMDNQQQKVDISQQFEFQNIQNKDSNLEFSSLGMQANFSPMNMMGVGLGVANIGMQPSSSQNIFGADDSQKTGQPFQSTNYSQYPGGNQM